MASFKLFLTRLLWLAVVVYTGFSLSQAVWRNVKVNQRIKELQQDTRKMEADSERLRNLIVYYHTDQFKELELRRRLGYKKPDENVVVLPPQFEQDESTVSKLRKPPKQEEAPYYLKWIESVTGIVI